MPTTLDEMKYVLAQREPRQETMTLVLGDGRGNVAVAEDSPIHLARILHGEDLEKVVRCLNYATSPTEGLYVQALKLTHPTYEAAYIVVSLGSRITQNVTEPFLPLHAPTHERRSWGDYGRDRVNVYTRMIVQGRVDPTNPPSMAVNIAHIRYRWAGKMRIFHSTTTDALSAASSMQQIALIYFLPSQNNYGIRYGPPGFPPGEPGVGEGEYPLASISLLPSTTAITDDVIVDRRDILSLNSLEQEGGGDMITTIYNNEETTIIVNARNADVQHNILTMSLPVLLV